jgi:hypothetical protein
MEYIEYGSCCDDCVQAIANDDYSGIDYYLSGDAADARVAEIRAGIAAVPGHLVVGDDQGFSWQRCDICNALAGNRHAVGYLQDQDTSA